MRLFLADRLCVSVEDIDFLNPNRLEDGRECGVRLEIRFVQADDFPGSIYASRGLSVGRAVCRFDLLESAPGAQDRMHWHPDMPDGEATARLFDDELRADPLGWLSKRLTDAVGTLELAGVDDPKRYARDAETLARQADAIVAEAAAGLDRFRKDAWPAVAGRDERGMAVA
ncbi:MAG TPA: hypothetical protein VGL06_30930 [Pseudonocardiaceae bacterium]